MVEILPALLETWVQSLSLQDLLVKEMANLLQYSCLEIQWREESGRLLSMGSQRVVHE